MLFDISENFSLSDSTLYAGCDSFSQHCNGTALAIMSCSRNKNKLLIASSDKHLLLVFISFGWKVDGFIIKNTSITLIAIIIEHFKNFKKSD